MTKAELLKYPVSNLIDIATASFKDCEKFEPKRFIQSLGKERIKQYLKYGNLHLETISDFLNGLLPPASEQIIVRRLKHPELNVRLYKKLTGLRLPVVYLQGHNKFNDDKLAPDVEAHFSQELILYRIEDINGNSKLNTFKKGYHAFLVDACKELDLGILQRIEIAKKKHDFVHVFLLKDTKISKSLADEIYTYGGDIIRDSLPSRGLDERILSFKKTFRNIPIYIENGLFKDNWIENCSTERQQLLKKTVSEVVSEQLKQVDPTDIEAFIYALGNNRIAHYTLSRLDLNEFYNFLNGDSSNINLLIGHEFNVYYVERLKTNNVKNVKFEVLNNNVCVDAMCDLEGTEPFEVILPDGKIIAKKYKAGTHVFEAKAHNNLTSKAVEDAYKLKQLFENVHIVVPSETKIHPTIFNELEKIGVDIIMRKISKRELKKRLYLIKKRFEEKRKELLKNKQEVKKLCITC